MDLVVVGISHRTAPIELRERLAFASEQMSECLQDLRSREHVDEAVIISTCNRTELVASGPAGRGLSKIVAQFLAENRKVPESELHPVLYRYHSYEAVNHLFRVAASLDSMVLGEPQIVGQVKEAYHAACEAGTCGPMLNRLFHKTFQVAKRVRTETKIAENAVSVSYAGVELARRIFGKLEGKEALLIGAGEMAELAVEHLLSAGLSKITIANRTYERAAKLASRFGGYAIGWDDIDSELQKADIVISSAAAPHFIITKGRLEPVMRARRYRPLFLIDLGVPRNIDPDSGELEGCYVYDLDDLEGVVEENKKARYAEAQEAEKIITAETEEFENYLSGLRVVPTIVTLRKRFDEIRKAEFEKALAKLDGIGDAERERIEYLTSALVNKLLHEPIAALKKAEADGDGAEVTQVVRQLFGLDDDEGAPALQEIKGEKK